MADARCGLERLCVLKPKSTTPLDPPIDICDTDALSEFLSNNQRFIESLEQELSHQESMHTTLMARESMQNVNTQKFSGLIAAQLSNMTHLSESIEKVCSTNAELQQKLEDESSSDNLETQEFKEHIKQIRQKQRQIRAFLKKSTRGVFT